MGDLQAVCGEVAAEYGADFQVAAAFETTVGRIRGLTETVEPARWPALADDDAAVLCFLDGAIYKAPGDAEPYNRAVVGVADGQGELIFAGYQDQIPAVAP